MVKKRKMKTRSFLIVLMIALGLSFCVYLLFQIPVKNILIQNTTYLKDDYILDYIELNQSQNFWLINHHKLEKELKKSVYIQDAKIYKKWKFLLEIHITENRPIFYSQNDSKYYFEDQSSIQEEDMNHFIRVPRLINYVPDKKFKKLIEAMSNVKEDVLLKISDMEYQPNDFDKDRFLLYMDDGNMVYLTLTKFKMINHYHDVIKQLENRKGILYLDNGNHFEIKE